jgi:hypothetical protein
MFTEETGFHEVFRAFLDYLVDVYQWDSGTVKEKALEYIDTWDR